MLVLEEITLEIVGVHRFFIQSFVRYAKPVHPQATDSERRRRSCRNRDWDFSKPVSKGNERAIQLSFLASSGTNFNFCVPKYSGGRSWSYPPNFLRNDHLIPVWPMSQNMDNPIGIVRIQGRELNQMTIPASFIHTFENNGFKWNCMETKNSIDATIGAKRTPLSSCNDCLSNTSPIHQIHFLKLQFGREYRINPRNGRGSKITLNILSVPPQSDDRLALQCLDPQPWFQIGWQNGCVRHSQDQTFGHYSI